MLFGGFGADKSARACLPFGRRDRAPAQSGAGRLEALVCDTSPLAFAFRLSATKPMNLPLEGPSDGFGRPMPRAAKIARAFRQARQICLKSAEIHA